MPTEQFYSLFSPVGIDVADACLGREALSGLGDRRNIPIARTMMPVMAGIFINVDGGAACQHVRSLLWHRRTATRSPMDWSSSHQDVTGLVHHQDVEHDDRRQAQDHRPDADRPKNVLGGKALLFRECIVPGIHDAPELAVLAGVLIRVEF